MQCKLCDSGNLEHKPGCPHDTPEDSFERKEFLRGKVDGKKRDPLRQPTDYYVLGWRMGAELHG